MNLELGVSGTEERKVLQKLFRVKRVEGQMMKDRGYLLDRVNVMNPDKTYKLMDLSPLQNINWRFEDFLKFRNDHQIFSTRQTFTSIYQKTNGEAALVIYLKNEPGKQVNKQGMEIVRAYLNSTEYQTYPFILITENGLGPNPSNFIRKQVAGRHIEVFQDIELAFKRPGHALAPIEIEHIARTSGINGVNPVDDWAKEEGVQPNKLPIMFNNDPIAKWYGAKPMDVMSMVVMGSSTDTAGYYRIVRQTPSKPK